MGAGRHAPDPDPCGVFLMTLSLKSNRRTPRTYALIYSTEFLLSNYVGQALG